MNKWTHMKQKKTGRKKEVGGRGRRKDHETKRRHGVLEKRHNGSTQKIRRKLESYSRKTDEKMESYSREADEKMESYSREADEKMENFSREADEKWKISQEKLMR